MFHSFRITKFSVSVLPLLTMIDIHSRQAGWVFLPSCCHQGLVLFHSNSTRIPHFLQLELLAMLQVTGWEAEIQVNLVHKWWLPPGHMARLLGPWPPCSSCLRAVAPHWHRRSEDAQCSVHRPWVPLKRTGRCFHPRFWDCGSEFFTTEGSAPSGRKLWSFSP